jgi:hypothetical protein
MSIQKILGKIVEDLEERMEDKKNREEVEVAEMPDDLAKEFRAMHDKKKMVEMEMEHELERIKLQVEQKYRDKMEGLSEVHQNLWKEVYKRFNLDPDQEYSYDRSEKKISQIIRKNKENEFEFTFTRDKDGPLN